MGQNIQLKRKKNKHNKKKHSNIKKHNQHNNKKQPQASQSQSSEPKVQSPPLQSPKRGKESKEQKNTPTKTTLESRLKTWEKMKPLCKSLFMLVMITITILMFSTGRFPPQHWSNFDLPFSNPFPSNDPEPKVDVVQPKVNAIDLVKRHLLPVMNRTPSDKIPVMMQINTALLISVSPSSDQSFLSFIKAAQSLQADLDKGCVSLDLGPNEKIQASSPSSLISITENQGLKCETQFSFFTEEAVSQNPKIIDFVLKDADTDTYNQRKRKFVFVFITKVLDAGLASFKQVWYENWIKINNADPDTFPKRFHDRIREKFLL